MKTIINFLMVIFGCFICALGIKLSHFFFEFPAIPGIMTVTFWKDTVAFGLVSVAGIVLIVIGIIHLVKSLRQLA